MVLDLIELLGKFVIFVIIIVLEDMSRICQVVVIFEFDCRNLVFILFFVRLPSVAVHLHGLMETSYILEMK